MSTHPNDNWLGDEWALVPQELQAKAWEYAPYCDLEFDGDELTDITDNGTRPPPEPVPEIPDYGEFIRGLIAGYNNVENK